MAINAGPANVPPRISPPPIRQRLVDLVTGLTDVRMWSLWFQQVFTGIRNAEDLAILQAATQEGGENAADQVQQAILAAPGDPAAGVRIDDVVDGRKLIYAGDSPNTQALVDVESLRQITAMNFEAPDRSAEIEDVRRLVYSMTGDTRAPQILLIIDTHANRANYPATGYPNGTMYFETDRTVFYIAMNGVWKFFTGRYSDLIASIPIDLGADDVGFNFWSTNYKHAFQWKPNGLGGYTWDFAAGDPGSSWIIAGTIAPYGGTWQLCDGSSTNVCTPTGILTMVTTPNMTGETFPMGSGGGSIGTVKVAARAKWEASATTEGESNTHVHNVSLSSVTVQSGTGATAAAASGYVTSADIPDHIHALTDAHAQLQIFSEATGGLPKRVALNWYMRL